MGRRLTPKENTLYQRVDEVLHYLWDPIGVRGCPRARDEYYSYLTKVYMLLQGGTGAGEIAEYLTGVERDRMGITPAPDRASEVAAILVDYRAWIRENAS